MSDHLSELRRRVADHFLLSRCRRPGALRWGGRLGALAMAGLLALGPGMPGAAASSPGQPQNVQIAPPKLGRTVHGTVLNAVHQPMAQAIVHLKQANSKVEHTVITDSEGEYSFYDLKPNTTYSVYAEWKGHKSPSRTDSQYNSQTKVRLDLTIPVG